MFARSTSHVATLPALSAVMAARSFCGIVLDVLVQQLVAFRPNTAALDSSVKKRSGQSEQIIYRETQGWVLHTCSCKDARSGTQTVVGGDPISSKQQGSLMHVSRRE